MLSKCEFSEQIGPVSLQIVLAFGNYMNSGKKGAAYGFRLQSLDLVSILVEFHYLTLPFFFKIKNVLYSIDIQYACVIHIFSG